MNHPSFAEIAESFRNLSPEDILGPPRALSYPAPLCFKAPGLIDLSPALAAALDRRGLIIERIVSPQKIAKALRGLKDQGVEISPDDFMAIRRARIDAFMRLHETAFGQEQAIFLVGNRMYAQPYEDAVFADDKKTLDMFARREIRLLFVDPQSFSDIPPCRHIYETRIVRSEGNRLATASFEALGEQETVYFSEYDDVSPTDEDMKWRWHDYREEALAYASFAMRYDRNAPSRLESLDVPVEAHARYSEDDCPHASSGEGVVLALRANTRLTTMAPMLVDAAHRTSFSLDSVERLGGQSLEMVTDILRLHGSPLSTQEFSSLREFRVKDIASIYTLEWDSQPALIFIPTVQSALEARNMIESVYDNWNNDDWNCAANDEEDDIDPAVIVDCSKPDAAFIFKRFEEGKIKALFVANETDETTLPRVEAIFNARANLSKDSLIVNMERHVAMAGDKSKAVIRYYAFFDF